MSGVEKRSGFAEAAQPLKYSQIVRLLYRRYENVYCIRACRRWQFVLISLKKIINRVIGHFLL